MMDADKNSGAPPDDGKHYHVGDVIITPDTISGPEVTYKLSALSRLEIKPRLGDIAHVWAFGLGTAIMVLLILTSSTSDQHGVARDFGDVLLTACMIFNVILHVRFMSVYGRLVGESKSGGSVVLSRSMTVTDAENALHAFQRFQTGAAA